MMNIGTVVDWILFLLLVLSALGVVIAKKPIYSSLSFLLTLMTLATIFLQLSAQFIAVMQILVYAGAILVIFMFVIILFQDVHEQIEQYKPICSPYLLIFAGSAFVTLLLVLAYVSEWLYPPQKPLPYGFGSAEELGKTLYIDFFFPFEAVILLFLIALVGALYIGRKTTEKDQTVVNDPAPEPGLRRDHTTLRNK